MEGVMIHTMKFSASANRNISGAGPVESVADILARELHTLIEDCLTESRTNQT
jgi:hypothetical protein